MTNKKGDYCYLLRTLKSILEKEETASWNFLEALLTQCLLSWFTGFSNHQPNKSVSEGYTTEFYFEMVEYLYTSQRLINPFNPEMINVFEKWMNKTSIDDHGSITLLLGLYGIVKGSSKHFEAYLETQEEGKLVGILESFEEYSSSYLNTPLTEIQEMVFDKVFSTLNTTSQFEMIGKSRFMDRFVKYLIEKDCIVNLLGGCLKANRISEGLKLIKLYTKVYATTVDWSLSDDELVKAFYEKLTVAIE
ncbi:hypothetical protein HDV02_000735 [Globomyces sp. JEL0801]|nr:hypothetical protein HDV02_000735 [Globomyces sp. JEL0801]